MKSSNHIQSFSVYFCLIKPDKTMPLSSAASYITWHEIIHSYSYSSMRMSLLRHVRRCQKCMCALKGHLFYSYSILPIHDCVHKLHSNYTLYSYLYPYLPLHNMIVCRKIIYQNVVTCNNIYHVLKIEWLPMHL